MKVDHLWKASIFPMSMGQHLGLLTKIAEKQLEHHLLALSMVLCIVPV